MKQKMLLLLLLSAALLLAGCGKGLETAGTTAPGDSGAGGQRIGAADSEQEYERYSNLNFVETQEGYYLACQVPKMVDGEETSAFMIHFCPRGESSFRPLCGKPNCRHQDEDCNAWADGTSSIHYYNGALYTEHNGFEGQKVIKRNMDGTDHQVVAEVAIKDQGYGYSSRFHGGQLFFRVFPNYALPLEEQRDRIYVLELSDGSLRELNLEGLEAYRLSGIEKITDQYLLLSVEEKENLDTTKPMVCVKLLALNMETGEVQTVDSEGYYFGFYMTDSKVYYGELDLTSELGEYGFEYKKPYPPGFRVYDLQSGTLEHIEPKEGEPAFTDGCYIYEAKFQEDENGVITKWCGIYSMEYELLDHFEMPEWLGYDSICSDRIFFSEMQLYPYKYYLDRSEIGSQHLELKPIEILP